MLETVLDKERIFEIYLNSVEWGRGVYGAEAAAVTTTGFPRAGSARGSRRASR
jgi:membrane carboxypeptidase/penicillin-binding protein